MPGTPPTSEDVLPLHLEVRGEIFHWRGPAPHHFVAVPEPARTALHEVSSLVTYGWGMIPVSAAIGKTTWTTSLFPKDGGYLVPIKAVVQRAEQLDVGDIVTIRLTVDATDR